MRSHSKSWQTALRAGLATAGILGGAFEGAPAAHVEAPAIIREAASMDKLVEGLMADIRTSRSLPGWAVNAAMNAYTVYKTYRNSQKVEEIGAAVLGMSKEVADLKAYADKGREMTEREYRLTRELLDSYGARLHAYDELLASFGTRLQASERRLASLVRDAKAIRAQFATWLYHNRACKQAEHVWRSTLGRSVHVSVARERR
jgi:hypothetical protein